MNSEHTGLEALLGVDDPLERRLALKSSMVEPYHLRIALQDEDPQVRECAALHPHLTPELITEFLHGDDRWLAEILLSRSDLTPELLEHALGQDDLREIAVQHPCVSEEQRRVNGGDISTPQLDKSEGPLAKNIGHITLPHFDNDPLRNKSAYFPEKYVRVHKVINRDKHARPDNQLGGETVFNSFPDDRTLSPHRRQMSILTRKFPLPPGQKRLGIKETQQEVGNENHEVQHGVFSRLAQKYGHVGRFKILTRMFHLLKQSRPQLHEHVEKLFSPYKEFYKPSEHSEEKIAFLHNYLTSPLYRDNVHTMLKMHHNKEAQRESVHKARQAFQKLQSIGSSIHPEDIGMEYKKFEDPIKDWVSNLKKSQVPDSQSVKDHLGHDYQKNALLQAVSFLASRTIDPEVYRARLHDTDDEIEAALLAANLPMTARPALESILTMGISENLFKSESTDAMIRQVTPLTHSALQFAEDIQWAAQHGRVEAVKLGGKHSAGSMIAHDKDGVLYLLKPGSGKTSPAAGESEESANQSRREACFYSIAKAWGVLDIPETHLLNIDGKEVAAIKMLGVNWTGLSRARTQNPNLPREVLKPLLTDGTLYRWATIDYVLGQADRHGNNLMVNGEGNVALIDHGSTFAGPSFNPAHDKYSFVPYYLRVWGPEKGWSKLSPEERFKALPVLPRALDVEVGEWVQDLDENVVSRLCHQFGINPEPSLERLKLLKGSIKAYGSASKAINALWVT